MRITIMSAIILIPVIHMALSGPQTQDTSKQALDLNSLSEELLREIRRGKSTEAIERQLSATTLDVLDNSLVTDDEKLAFWINIYNAYIQIILSKDPERYEDRSAFFSAEQIEIAGRELSFSKIEHGIIRKSQWELGLGYISKWFPDEFERRLRVEDRDYRIHFALNCGAKDCPPVVIYSPERLNEQLERGTKMYLEKTSAYDKTANEVTVTPLFKWFRGDFGGEDGIREILTDCEIIPHPNGMGLKYREYDWTLELNNFIDQ